MGEFPQKRPERGPSVKSHSVFTPLGTKSHKDQVGHYSWRTEQTYREWAWRLAQFMGQRELESATGEDLKAFLSQLAVKGRVSVSTQPAGCLNLSSDSKGPCNLDSLSCVFKLGPKVAGRHDVRWRIGRARAAGKRSKEARNKQGTS